METASEQGTALDDETFHIICLIVEKPFTTAAITLLHKGQSQEDCHAMLLLCRLDET